MDKEIVIVKLSKKRDVVFDTNFVLIRSTIPDGIITLTYEELDKLIQLMPEDKKESLRSLRSLR